MSPIVTIQAAWRELGRIRIGQQVEFVRDGQTKRRPEKLKTFRLTSPHRESLEMAAEIYQGTVQRWAEAPDGDEWELITTTDTLDIIVPKGEPISQWYECWSGGGCTRRCDGVREVLTMSPCKCPTDPNERQALAAKGQACKPTTRLQVILPRLPDIGTWLLVSHGYYAASELMGTVQLLRAAAEAGRMIPAALWIDQRHITRPGQPRRDFAVPAIRILETLQALTAGGSGPTQPALPPGRPRLPEPPALPESPAFRQIAAPAATAAVVAAACGAPSPHREGQWCVEEPHGRDRNHRSANKESWRVTD